MKESSPRFQAPMSAPRPHSARLLTAFSPKLGRAARAFDCPAFGQWIRLETDPAVSKFCEHPRRVGCAAARSSFRCAQFVDQPVRQLARVGSAAQVRRDPEHQLVGSCRKAQRRDQRSAAQVVAHEHPGHIGQPEAALGRLDQQVEVIEGVVDVQVAEVLTATPAPVDPSMGSGSRHHQPRAGQIGGRQMAWNIKRLHLLQAA